MEGSIYSAIWPLIRQRTWEEHAGHRNREGDGAEAASYMANPVAARRYVWREQSEQGGDRWRGRRARPRGPAGLYCKYSRTPLWGLSAGEWHGSVNGLMDNSGCWRLLWRGQNGRKVTCEEMGGGWACVEKEWGLCHSLRATQTKSH